MKYERKHDCGEILVAKYIITGGVFSSCLVLESYRIPWKSVFTLCIYFVTTGRAYYKRHTRPQLSKEQGLRALKIMPLLLNGGDVCCLTQLLLLLLLACACVSTNTHAKVVFRHACRDSWGHRVNKAQSIARERYRNTDPRHAPTAS